MSNPSASSSLAYQRLGMANSASSSPSRPMTPRGPRLSRRERIAQVNRNRSARANSPLLRLSQSLSRVEDGTESAEPKQRASSQPRGGSLYPEARAESQTLSESHIQKDEGTQTTSQAGLQVEETAQAIAVPLTEGPQPLETSLWQPPSPQPSYARPHVARRSPLVRSCEHLLKPNGSIVGKHVARTILPNFPSLCSAIPAEESSHAALGSTDGRRPISHARIRDFILCHVGPTLHGLGMGRGCRVALVLPNGPELALALLSVAHWAACVPLAAHGNAQTELERDLQTAGVQLVIGQECSYVKECAQRLDIPFCGLVPSTAEAGIFELVPPASPTRRRRPRPLPRAAAEADRSAGTVRSPEGTGETTEEGEQDDVIEEDDAATMTSMVSASTMTSGTTPTSSFPVHWLPNTHKDEVLVLFTSGTTGQKKMVPHVLGDMLVAAATIALSWNLTNTDVNCNLMPLFHVGGIVRQVFSPILSGGCVICCPAFDPSLFWDLAERDAFTWYYAAPTMHQLILQTKNQYSTKPCKLRMIANAAGGLLPSLARALRDTFGATVLPSYGMTECMPISSPPVTYQLEKPGTSGVAVGPEVAILDISTMQTLEPGKEGTICVRGQPCFRGYDDGEGDKKKAFLQGGWFNTGDLGHMDADGFLYITGRSKEVINRGGEIISPLEVEEAVVSHDDIQACAAFSALHNVLQEMVGIVLVMKQGRPRLDLKALHDYLGQGQGLLPVKWPQCVVYMDALPKSNTNKLLRVHLGRRLGLPEFHDGMHAMERSFHATCPPQGTSVKVAIPCQQVTLEPARIQEALHAALLLKNDQEVHVLHHPSRKGTAVVAYVHNIDRLQLISAAKEALDAYEVPSHVCLLPQAGMTSESPSWPMPGSEDAVAHLLQHPQGKPRGNDDALVQDVQRLFQDILDLDCMPAPDTNFFNLGGSSMLASQLAFSIRKKYKIACTGADVFHISTCNDMAGHIRQEQQQAQLQDQGSDPDSMMNRTILNAPSPTGPQGEGDVGSATSSAWSWLAWSNAKDPRVDTQGAPFASWRLVPELTWWKALIQLIPLCILFPVWQVSRFFLFFSSLIAILTHVPSLHNIWTFVFTLVIFHFMWITITPLFLVVIKWVVIGKYKPGRYAFWSIYYLQWWFVEVCRKLLGRGIWGSNPILLNMYYRMLGASIGTDARISLEADVAEYDLVTIGPGAAVDYSTVRGFGLDNGAMILGPVIVGAYSSVGVRSVVAPFTSVPPETHLGPATSTYELGGNSRKSSKDEEDKKVCVPDHASYNRSALAEPDVWIQLLVGSPITFAVDTLSHMPALLVLYWMLQMPWHNHNGSFVTLGALMEWLCDPRRIPFYIGVRVARAILAPLVYMSGAILVKRFIIGRFEAGPRDTSSQWQLLRHWLAATLFTRERMQEVTELLGRHYQLVSLLYRALGAKIGKRVFWPGHPPVFTGEFDLLTVGDDVVFGSRATIYCTTLTSSEPVTFCAGSNISDNTVVLPGSIVGKNAVLGSNTICPAGWYLPEASIWFGSRAGDEPVLLEKGVELSAAKTKPAPEPPSTGSNRTRQHRLLASNVSIAQLALQGDETTLRPFGKAFYNREASYFVWPLPMVIGFTVLVRILIAIVHTVPLLGALHGAAAVLYGSSVEDRDYRVDYPTPVVYMTLLWVFMFTHLARVAVWLITEYASKWGFMGRREEGRYNWDDSDYCQNWELYQLVTQIRRFGRLNLMDFLAGTPFLVTFFQSLGCNVGKDCCLYPAGGDPYMPEPDLVIIGDRCAVDCASIVCHLNTRGNFELAKIVMDNHVTLRARSRIQQGVRMEAGSMILEKSLAMTGEVMEADSVWQGAPATRLFSYTASAGVPPSMSFGLDSLRSNPPPPPPCPDNVGAVV